MIGSKRVDFEGEENSLSLTWPFFIKAGGENYNDVGKTENKTHQKLRSVLFFFFFKLFIAVIFSPEMTLWVTVAFPCSGLFFRDSVLLISCATCKIGIYCSPYYILKRVLTIRVLCAL